jgi:hypothetical protein
MYGAIMTTFSRRYGYGPQGPTEPVIEDAPPWLRTKFMRIINHITYIEDTRHRNYDGRPLGVKYLIEMISDQLRQEPGNEAWDSDECRDYLEAIVTGVEWFNFYNIVETVGKGVKNEEQKWLNAVTLKSDEEIEAHIEQFGFETYRKKVNEIFVDETIGWRLDKDGLLKRESPKNLTGRIEKIEKTLKDQFEPAREHYRKAVRYANARPLDPENSIKEVISAVESVGRVLYQDTRTLGDVVKHMKKEQKWPQQLVTVIEKFYGYTCSEPAVRHGGSVSSRVISDDAEFCLHVGAALIRYMIAYSKRTI